MERRIDTPLVQYLILGLLALTWGSSFILMKRGLESFSSFQVAEYRLFIAFVALLPIAIRNLPKFPKTGKQRIGIVVVGLAGNFFPAFLFAEAQTRLPSGITGMLNSMVPLFTLILGVLAFGASTNRRQVLGVFIGLIGAITLISFSHDGTHVDVPLIYPLYIVAATLCYATSVNIIKAFLQEVNAIHITAFAFLVIGPIAGLGLLTGDFWSEAFRTSANLINLGYITILGVVGTAAALLLFNQLIKATTAIFASTVTYLIPIVAMSWGILDGETVTLMHAGGMGLILFGVYLINRKKKQAVNR
ncbi:DMT family transporter [bacterium SCSIO 12741]|nr:DMT family transporter [bacterium SCSIO 12741]